MFLFLMTLLVLVSTHSTPNPPEGTQTIPSDPEAQTVNNYATAYYWDMYGATGAVK